MTGKKKSHHDFKHWYFYKKTKFFSIELLEIHRDREIKRGRFINSAGTARAINSTGTAKHV